MSLAVEFRYRFTLRKGQTFFVSDPAKRVGRQPFMPRPRNRHPQPPRGDKQRQRSRDNNRPSQQHPAKPRGIAVIQRVNRGRRQRVHSDNRSALCLLRPAQQAHGPLCALVIQCDGRLLAIIQKQIIPDAVVHPRKRQLKVKLGVGVGRRQGNGNYRQRICQSPRSIARENSSTKGLRDKGPCQGKAMAYASLPCARPRPPNGYLQVQEKPDAVLNLMHGIRMKRSSCPKNSPRRYGTDLVANNVADFGQSTFRRIDLEI